MPVIIPADLSDLTRHRAVKVLKQAAMESAILRFKEIPSEPSFQFLTGREMIDKIRALRCIEGDAVFVSQNVTIHCKAIGNFTGNNPTWKFVWADTVSGKITPTKAAEILSEFI